MSRWIAANDSFDTDVKDIFSSKITRQDPKFYDTIDRMLHYKTINPVMEYIIDPRYRWAAQLISSNILTPDDGERYELADKLSKNTEYMFKPIKEYEDIYKNEILETI